MSERFPAVDSSLSTASDSQTEDFPMPMRTDEGAEKLELTESVFDESAGRRAQKSALGRLPQGQGDPVRIH